MEDSKNIMNKKLFTLAQAASFALALSWAVYTVTRIYDRFELGEANDVRLEQKIDAVDDRVTKIGGRNADAIKKLQGD